jgi:hypothetical protein
LFPSGFKWEAVAPGDSIVVTNDFVQTVIKMEEAQEMAGIMLIPPHYVSQASRRQSFLGGEDKSIGSESLSLTLPSSSLSPSPTSQGLLAGASHRYYADLPQSLFSICYSFIHRILEMGDAGSSGSTVKVKRGGGGKGSGDGGAERGGIDWTDMEMFIKRAMMTYRSAFRRAAQEQGRDRMMGGRGGGEEEEVVDYYYGGGGEDSDYYSDLDNQEDQRAEVEEKIKKAKKRSIEDEAGGGPDIIGLPGDAGESAYTRRSKAQGRFQLILIFLFFIFQYLLFIIFFFFFFFFFLNTQQIDCNGGLSGEQNRRTV